MATSLKIPVSSMVEVEQPMMAIGYVKLQGSTKLVKCICRALDVYNESNGKDLQTDIDNVLNNISALLNKNESLASSILELKTQQLENINNIKNLLDTQCYIIKIDVESNGFFPDENGVSNGYSVSYNDIEIDLFKINKNPSFIEYYYKEDEDGINSKFFRIPITMVKYTLGPHMEPGLFIYGNLETELYSYDLKSNNLAVGTAADHVITLTRHEKH